MKKQWNELCQEWVYELESRDIKCEKNSHTAEGTIVLVISTPNQESPYRVDVKWS